MKNLLKSRNTGLIAVLIILLVIARFLTPGMFTATSLVSMLQNNTIYALLAIAEMMVILTGGIDISIASQLAFVGISCTTLACSHPGIPGIVWVLFAIVLGALCGALNGFLVPSHGSDDLYSGYNVHLPWSCVCCFWRTVVVRSTVRRTERIPYVCNRTVFRTADHPLGHDHSAGCSRTVPWIYFCRKKNLCNRYIS